MGENIDAIFLRLGFQCPVACSKFRLAAPNAKEYPIPNLLTMLLQQVKQTRILGGGDKRSPCRKN